MPNNEIKATSPKVNLGVFLKPYAKNIGILFILAIISNGLNLAIPTLIGQTIDKYRQTGSINFLNSLFVLGIVAVAVLLFTILQTVISTITSEKVALDLRTKITLKLSEQTYGYVAKASPAKLLTNYTSDIDSVKTIISQGVVTAFSAVLILIGSAVALLRLNLNLALMVLSIIPLIALVFALIFGKIGKLFKATQKNLEKINRIINESIVASSLIRVLNSKQSEINKFTVVNQKSREIGLSIINLFSALIPVVTLLSNLATVLILYFGGLEVISGNLSLGEFSAFFSYLNLLITPIFLLSFISTSLSRAVISLGRINEVLEYPVIEHFGNIEQNIEGLIQFEAVNLELGNKQILKNISFEIKPNTKTAILGPTASGKSQLFALLAGLEQPTSGKIKIDNIELPNFERNSLYSQLGLVFQDSIIFNTTLRENIMFRDLKANSDDENALELAIETASLSDLIESLPNGLETVISERGANLSGGQKQRLILARALAIKPKILLLDDFTARVDIATEKQILDNLAKNYPDLTLVSITQKISSIIDYDQILVMMEGELIAGGTHTELLQNSLEYRQIYESQQGTE